MAYFAMSFRAFIGRSLITFRAGFALNICSTLVKGLIPLRALTAGFWITMTFSRPGTTNTPGPFLPTAFSISTEKAVEDRSHLLARQLGRRSDVDENLTLRSGFGSRCHAILLLYAEGNSSVTVS